MRHTTKTSSPKKVAAKKSLARGERRKRPGASRNFPIVGIGASAGGLEALEDLLASLPRSPGVAIVIIQHLEPTHISQAGEILERRTTLPVREAEDGMLVKTNHIYLIPANKNLQIEGGRLRVTPRTALLGQHLPVNSFFVSLAADQKSRAVGVVLSGTASDGTDGLRAIKEAGGLTIAQDPESARHDGMPRNAISAGHVDVVLEPNAIGKELVRIARAFTELGTEPQVRDSVSRDLDDGIADVLEVLKVSCHIDFSHYKHTTLKRRINRRMVLSRKNSLEEYLRYLRNNEQEAKLLFSDLLINVTEFFRDSESFDRLKRTILPSLLKMRLANSPIRIWVVGCATGEEAYSIAITLLEILGASSKAAPVVQIFATDVSETAIRKARLGVFPESIRENVSGERLRRFFTKTDGGYRVNKSVRDLCLFSRHDVTSDPPFAKIDLISCRNVLIYFDLHLQRQVLPIFHYSLNPKGVLWVGRSESIAGLSALFLAKSRAPNFFTRSARQTTVRFRFPANHYIAEKFGDERSLAINRPAASRLQDEVTRRLVSKYAPPSLVVNSDMEIVLSNGETSPFVHLPTGQVTLNLFKMAPKEINADLRMALQSAKKRGAAVRKDGLKIRDGTKVVAFSLSVVPIKILSEGREPYFLILFESSQPSERSTSVTKGRLKNRERYLLEKKLAETKAYQLSIVEDFEAAQEQLAAANEELQSTNEEMQSTNEELETAKEELQSTNEELTTVNDELENRNLEMTQANNDLLNLVGAIEIPVVIVGLDARIRRFTPAAARMLNLIASDIGRPIGDIRPDVLDPISNVLTKVTSVEQEIQERDGQWFRLTLRPYLTIDKKLDGAVISFIDINHLKTRLDESKRLLELSEKLANSVRIPLVVLNQELRIQSTNHAFDEHFAANLKVLGKDFLSTFGLEEAALPLRAKLERLFTTETEIRDLEVEVKVNGLSSHVFNFNAHKIDWDNNLGEALLVSVEDVTVRRRIEQELALSEEKFRGLVDGAHDAILSVDSKGIVEFANKKVATLLGYRPEEVVGKSIETLVPERSRIVHAENRERYNQEPKARRMGEGLELFARRKDGAEIPVDISLSPRKTSHGVVVTAILRDISDRKATERERELLLESERNARADAESANKIKDAFLATLSHELRTPMTSILSWAQLIQKGVLPPEKIKHAIEVIEQSAKAQGQLIDDLLDVTRIQAGKLSLNMGQTDPEKVIEAAIDSVSLLAEAKSVRIEKEFATHGQQVWADPQRLQQVIWNLLSNAVKFSKKGDAIQVRTKILQESADSSFASIEVVDHGKGLREDFVPLLFKRFTQADSSSTRHSGGLGLGLFIVNDLCRLMGGKISAHSEGLGKGAVFSVRLALGPPSGDIATGNLGRSNFDASEEISAQPNLTGLKVLIVDDEPAALEVLNETLVSFGARTVVCSSAAEALSAFGKEIPDIIVSDIAMPGEDGYSLIKKVRDLGESAGGKTPALALTAYASSDDVKRAMSAGFDGHMAKPFDTFLLGHAVRRLVRPRQNLI